MWKGAFGSWVFVVFDGRVELRAPSLAVETLLSRILLGKAAESAQRLRRWRVGRPRARLSASPRSPFGTRRGIRWTVDPFVAREGSQTPQLPAAATDELC